MAKEKRGKPMYKILIVEDDEVIGRTVQRHLQEWGYEAVCVNDLKHVLEEFAVRS